MSSQIISIQLVNVNTALLIHACKPDEISNPSAGIQLFVNESEYITPEFFRVYISPSFEIWHLV